MFRQGDIVLHKVSGNHAVVCSDSIDKLSGQWTIYYLDSPVLSGANPENLELDQRTNLPWRRAANVLRTTNEARKQMEAGTFKFNFPV